MCVVFVFFKQKTAYEMRISDWSSDVCSSDLIEHQRSLVTRPCAGYNLGVQTRLRANNMSQNHCGNQAGFTVLASNRKNAPTRALRVIVDFPNESLLKILKLERLSRSEEHTYELQSLMRISYAVFCLKKKRHQQEHKRTYSTMKQKYTIHYTTH